MADYTVAKREDAVDWMAEYPGFGEMRWYTEALPAAEQVSFSWRPMPPEHRRPGQLRPPPPRPGGDLLRDRRARSRSRSATTSSRPARRPAVRMSGEALLLGPQRHRRGRRAAPVLDPRPQRRRPSRPTGLLARGLTASAPAGPRDPPAVEESVCPPMAGSTDRSSSNEEEDDRQDHVDGEQLDALEPGRLAVVCHVRWRPGQRGSPRRARRR